MSSHDSSNRSELLNRREAIHRVSLLFGGVALVVELADVRRRQGARSARLAAGPAGLDRGEALVVVAAFHKLPKTPVALQKGLPTRFPVRS